MTVRVLEAPLEGLNPVQRLTADLKKAAKTLTDKEARYLVDGYYVLQGYRIAAHNQVTSLEESKEPNDVLKWFFGNAESLENQMKRALGAYAESSPVGRWSLSICGIGPVIAAGLLAHIDMNEAPTAGHIWRFAGLDPTSTWYGKEGSKDVIDEVAKKFPDLVPAKKEAVPYEFIVHIAKATNRNPQRINTAAVDEELGYVTMDSLKANLSRRPWNATLKTLCWKIGESFLKVSKNPNDFYGKLYVERKVWETANNEKLMYKDQAEEKLRKFKIGKSTDAYKAYIVGKLPDGRIHARAKRYAVKIFLSHWHAVAFETKFNRPAPTPWVIAYKPEHTHKISVPNWPMPEEQSTI